jgi:2-polyprenyl-3-methyl-5-hydroxy-6-metoxy-1,4-benzoquinol methylase
MTRLADAPARWHSTAQDRDPMRVQAYFEAESAFWNGLYASNDVYAQVHRLRHATALSWIEQLTPAADVCALDVGCGAGYMSLDLATRGWRTQAMDTAEAMVAQVRQRAAAAGLAAEQLVASQGDASALAFDPASFDLVVALGVIPWLAEPWQTVHEMARVTRLGGYVLLSADNRARLDHLADPWRNPLVMPLKRRVKAGLARAGVYRLPAGSAGTMTYTRRTIDRALMDAGLSPVRSTTLGFGPFTLGGRRVLPESLGLQMHQWLQRLADRGTPILRSAGTQYLVLARKEAASAGT